MGLFNYIKHKKKRQVVCCSCQEFQTFQESVSSNDGISGFTFLSSSSGGGAHKLSKMQKVEEPRVHIYHVAQIHTALWRVFFFF